MADLPCVTCETTPATPQRPGTTPRTGHRARPCAQQSAWRGSPPRRFLDPEGSRALEHIALDRQLGVLRATARPTRRARSRSPSLGHPEHAGPGSPTDPACPRPGPAPRPPARSTCPSPGRSGLEFLASFTTTGISNGPTEAVNLLIKKSRQPRIPKLRQLPATPPLHCGIDLATHPRLHYDADTTLGRVAPHFSTRILHNVGLCAIWYPGQSG